MALLIAALPAPALAQEEECSAILGRDGAMSYELVPDYSISAQTPPLSPPPVSGELRGIMCVRETLRLAPNDLRVVTDLGVPLFVGVWEGDDRMLELHGGGLSVSGGRATPDERIALQRAYEELAAEARHD